MIAWFEGISALHTQGVWFFTLIVALSAYALKQCTSDTMDSSARIWAGLVCIFSFIGALWVALVIVYR